jgi:hypothetical protein
MNNLSTAIRTALALIAGNDSDLRSIVILSLQVSLTASLCAVVIAEPLGTALAVAVAVFASGLIGVVLQRLLHESSTTGGARDMIGANRHRSARTSTWGPRDRVRLRRRRGLQTVSAPIFG